MNAEFSADLPMMVGEEKTWLWRVDETWHGMVEKKKTEYTTKGLLAFVQENTFALERNEELPDELKDILAVWSKPKVGNKFFLNGVWHEITEDGCREVEVNPMLAGLKGHLIGSWMIRVTTVYCGRNGQYIDFDRDVDTGEFRATMGLFATNAAIPALCEALEVYYGDDFGFHNESSSNIVLERMLCDKCHEPTRYLFWRTEGATFICPACSPPEPEIDYDDVCPTCGGSCEDPYDCD